MKITERRLRSIIRSVIKESIKAESLDLSSLVNIGLISAKEQNDIESAINESLEEGISSIGKLGGIVAACILAITIAADVSSNMKKTRSDLARQRQIDTQAIELAIESKGNLQSAYDKYKAILHRADQGDQQAQYELDMIHDGLNACTQYKVLRSRDIELRHPSWPQRDNNPTRGLARGDIVHRVDRLDMGNDPKYGNDQHQIRVLCYEFSDAVTSTDLYLLNNPGAFNP